MYLMKSAFIRYNHLLIGQDIMPSDQEYQAVLAENQKLKKEKQGMSQRLSQALDYVVQEVNNDFERNQSWCFSLIRKSISSILPQQAAKDWENWIHNIYQKYKSSNWKWVVRILIGALIGWLLGELLLATFGKRTFMLNLIKRYKWIKPVVVDWGSKILSASGSMWNSVIAFLRGV